MSNVWKVFALLLVVAVIAASAIVAANVGSRMKKGVLTPFVVVAVFSGSLISIGFLLEAMTTALGLV